MEYSVIDAGGEGGFIFYEGETYNEITQAQSAISGLASGNIDPSKLSPDIINSMKNWFPYTLASIMKTDANKVQNMTVDEIRKYLISSNQNGMNMIIPIIIGVVMVIVLIFLLISI